MSVAGYTQTAMPPSARSAVTGRSRRVLLVHANPFQRVTPVPAYGLERLRTARVQLDEPRVDVVVARYGLGWCACCFLHTASL